MPELAVRTTFEARPFISCDTSVTGIRSRVPRASILVMALPTARRSVVPAVPVITTSSRFTDSSLSTNASVALPAPMVRDCA